MPRKKSDNLGKSDATVPDLTQDQQALLKIKELEKKLKSKLVSYQLDKNTIITTTKDRLDDLINQHLNPTISR